MLFMLEFTYKKKIKWTIRNIAIRRYLHKNMVCSAFDNFFTQQQHSVGMHKNHTYENYHESCKHHENHYNLENFGGAMIEPCIKDDINSWE